MKKILIAASFVVVMVAIIFLSLKWFSYSRDLEIHKKLTGTWIWEFYNIRGTNFVASDGHFKAEEAISHSGKIRIVQTEGTLQIKNGILIRTTNNRTPPINYGRIIRIDNQELIIRWDGADTNSVWQKIQ